MEQTSKKIIIFLFGILLLNLTLAEINDYAPVKIGDCITIKQTCASCSYVNISISYPNSTLAVINKPMTSAGGGLWYYNFCNTNQKGRYDVMGSGDLEGTDTSFNSVYFDVSATGKDLTTSKVISYSIILIFSILFLIGIILIIIKLPSNNKRDELTGYILAVSNLKYVRYFLTWFSYLIVVWISYFVWMISYAFLDFSFLNSILKFIFFFLVILILPAFILFVYLLIANFIRDQKVKDFLMRGLPIK
jgi:hypothetical protein